MMLSRNNWKEMNHEIQSKKQRFSLRKLTVGVASVLVGLTFMGYNVDAHASVDPAMSSTSSETQINYPLSTPSETPTIVKTKPSDPVPPVTTYSDVTKTEWRYIPRPEQGNTPTSSSTSQTSDVRTNPIFAEEPTVVTTTMIPSRKPVKPYSISSERDIRYSFSEPGNATVTGLQPRNGGNKIGGGVNENVLSSTSVATPSSVTTVNQTLATKRPLPQTGNTNTSAALISLGLASLTAMFGLAGKKRRN